MDLTVLCVLIGESPMQMQVWQLLAELPGVLNI